MDGPTTSTRNDRADGKGVWTRRDFAFQVIHVILTSALNEPILPYGCDADEASKKHSHSVITRGVDEAISGS